LVQVLVEAHVFLGLWGHLLWSSRSLRGGFREDDGVVVVVVVVVVECVQLLHHLAVVVVGCCCCLDRDRSRQHIGAVLCVANGHVAVLLLPVGGAGMSVESKRQGHTGTAT